VEAECSSNCEINKKWRKKLEKKRPHFDLHNIVDFWFVSSWKNNFRALIYKKKFLLENFKVKQF